MRARSVAAWVALGALLPAACSLAEERPIHLAAAGDAAAQTTAKECGACHMAYPAEFLPQRSWIALLGHLDTHFGEDASLPEATRAAILGYLTANAADSPRGNRRILAGLSPGQTPERITDMPFWRRIHHRLLRPGVGTGPGVRSAADCARCHNGAGGGDDD